MILNFREMGPAEQRYVGGRVTVDGVEVKLAWFIDTEAGLVKTYDVLGDGKAHAWDERLDWVCVPAGVYGTAGGAAWKAVEGRVELFETPMLTVIIPSRNAANLVPCLEAVRRNEPHVQVLVIDDGLGIQPHGAQAEYIQGVKPFIFARNVNAGIAKAKGDVVLLNDDALLQTAGGFTAMQQAAQEQPQYGVLSATTDVAGNAAQQPQGTGGIRFEARTVAFVCVLIRRAAIDKVGLLDERFTAYGWEDNDYCRRVRNAGMRSGIFDGCYVNHSSLTSTFRGAPRAAGDIHAGAAIYRDKWGDLL